MSYSISSFTSTHSLLALAVAKSAGKFTTPSRGETRTFVAIALEDGVILNKEQFEKWLGETNIEVKQGPMKAPARVIVRAKVIADEHDRPIEAMDNPFAKLDDPCDFNYSDPVEFKEAMAIMAQYTYFISGKDFSLSDDTTIRKNDQIYVSLKTDSNGALILDGTAGRLISLKSRAKDEYTNLDTCQILSNVFAAQASAGGIPPGTGAINSSTRFSYPGETRKIPFSTYQNAKACDPANTEAETLQDYFTNTQWEAFKKSLAQFEGNYASANQWQYMGKYQFSVHKMKKYKMITQAAYDSIGGSKFSQSGELGKEKQLSVEKKLKTMYDNPTSWAGTDGVSSRADWIANKNDAQEKMFIKHANDEFKDLKSKGLIDTSNPSDVGGMIAAAHLLGTGGAANMRKNGIVKADGNSMPGHVYYVVVGQGTCP